MLDVGVQQKTEELAETAEIANAASSADIVVGILSYNNVGTIGAVTRGAQEGLAAFFPLKRGVVVNVDGGSKDGTHETALASILDKKNFVQITSPISPAQKISPEYYGLPGKANAVQSVLAIAGDLKAKACVVVDCNSGIPSPDSIGALARPVMEEGIDFVSPLYLRHKFDGAILTGIVYPLTRALYGKKIHQPIGGDYALSEKLMKHLMSQPGPDGDATSSAADAWISIHALCGSFLCGEASLGPRVLTRHEPAPEVSTMLSHALGAIFAEMNRTATVWQRRRGSQAVPVFGPLFQPPGEPEAADPSLMLQTFHLGYQNLQDIYRLVLPPATLVELKRMSLDTADKFHFDDSLWARIIYDFALAWRTRTIDRDHLLRALTPLYLGWVAAWIRAVGDAGPEETQDRIETLCLAWEMQKGYLISRWRWPDRFNP